MKNKFVLTEDESKRILSLHKERINEERGEIQEADPTATWGYTFLTLGLNHAFGATAGKSYDKVKRAFYKCDLGEFNNPTMSSSIISNYARAINDSIEGVGTEEDKLFYTVSQIKKFDDFCAVSKAYRKKYSESLWNALDGDIDLESEWKRLWKSLERMTISQSPTQMKENAKKCGWGTDYDGYKNSGWKCPKTGGGTSSGCPKIEKSFTDQGYVKITQQRYQELANDSTRVRKYKWCPITKKNLYFAKVVSGGGDEGGGGGGGTGGGGSRGQRYGFDYQKALNAIKSKCGASGGGSPEEEQFADDWRSTQDTETKVNTTATSDNVKSWAS